jgi:hypothetical protein
VETGVGLVGSGPSEAFNHDGCGDEEEEDQGREDAVCQDDGVVLGHGGEAVAHSCAGAMVSSSCSGVGDAVGERETNHCTA